MAAADLAAWLPWPYISATGSWRSRSARVRSSSVDSAELIWLGPTKALANGSSWDAAGWLLRAGQGFRDRLMALTSHAPLLRCCRPLQPFSDHQQAAADFKRGPKEQPLLVSMQLAYRLGAASVSRCLAQSHPRPVCWPGRVLYYAPPAACVQGFRCLAWQVDDVAAHEPVMPPPSP